MKINKNAAVSWTGGKDSALAYQLICNQGYDVKFLLTFVPANGKQFLAHPIEEIESQSKKMAVPLLKYKVREECAQKDYIVALRHLKQTYGIQHIVTGDIDYVQQMPNWMAECAALAKINAHFPLWQKPREEVLELLFKHKIQFKISYVNSALIEDWKGKEINTTNVQDFIMTCTKHHVDIGGENGEYHSMVFAAPFFINADSLDSKQE